VELSETPKIRISGITKVGVNRFRKHDKIGKADAEEDSEFLSECFIDTGDMAVLSNCGDTRRILIGRTGVGKTALLQRLEEHGHAIRIQPENLAFEHISNSDILRFVAQLGVNLDTFFKLLWRHVLAVELIKRHFGVVDRAAKSSLFSRIKGFFTGSGTKDAEALEYLELWGDSFWQDTDYRLKEVTTKLEEDIKASVGVSNLPIQFSAEGAKKLSAEERHDVIQRTQHVINQVHIRKLSQVLDLMDRVLDDPQVKYYILIDRLDENWVEDNLRYALIRALIETARDFRKIRHAKVILALRVDLIDRVFELTRDAGFQEEKYESLYLPITWSEIQLTEVLDARINFLFKSRRSDRVVMHQDVLPDRIGKVPIMEYMLQRTLMRPRDIILFFNYCLAEAVGRAQITATMIRHAEGEYSLDRLRSLGDEWRAQYPNLLALAAILKGRRASFDFEDIEDSEIEELCLTVAADDEVSADELTAGAREVANCNMTPSEFKKTLIDVFYKIGLVGVKPESFQPVLWSCTGVRTLLATALRSDARILVHACFHRAMGIIPDGH
jgi:hypothetical protein